ncbi:MAG: hypothetical protein JSU73_00990 [candidate division WOR-3 bacterium]|nr:MAG: hypothetical protein JSU73_00990 [candidate division WOR-3 bacterium]
MKRLLLLVLIGCWIAGARVMLRLHLPPEGKLGTENLWWVDVYNPDSVLHNRWFKGEVSERKAGRVFWATTWPFDVELGRTTFRLADIKVRDQEAKPGYEFFVLRTGELPEGEYSYRVLLMPDNVGDSYTTRVERPGPPRLMLPRDDEDVRARFPQFSWTRPMPVPRSAVTYRVRIAEVLKGQTDEEALKANPFWFETSGLSRVSLRFPVSGRMFDKGRRYAWQVDAMSGMKVLGTSEVNGFWYHQQPELMCGCRIDSIYVGDVKVGIGTTYDFVDRGRPELKFFTSCDEDEECAILGHYWRVTEQDDDEHVVGAGTGTEFQVPPLGRPRSLAVFVSVRCRCGKITTRAINLNIGS